MKIYTKSGDKGETGLFGGGRVGKDCLRIETYGTVDELNSLLGLVAAECEHIKIREMVVKIQGQLLDLGSDLATPRGNKHEGKVKRTGTEESAMLEDWIDAAEAQLPMLTRFILPGGTVTASRLHLARTVCRRAERLLVRLMREEEMGADALVYLNRLSDLLFVFARLANKLSGVPDVFR